MTNAEAIVLLDELIEQAYKTIRGAAWTQALLVVGGEPTWDAVKSVSRGAAEIALTAEKVAEFETRFEEILP